MQTSRQDKRRELTRASLIKAAQELFVDHGFDETTIDDIVHAADVAKVTFYYHFKSKDEILHAIGMNAAQAMLTETERLVVEDAQLRVILERLIEDATAFAKENWQLIKVFSEQFKRRQMERDFAPECKMPIAALLERAITQAQARGEIKRSVNAQDVSIMIDFTIVTSQFLWIHNGREDSLDQKMAQTLEFILYGIAGAPE